MAEAKITLVLDDDQAIKGLLHIEDQAKETAQKSGNEFTKAFSGVTKSILAIGAAYLSFREAKSLIEESIREASKQEDAVNSLNAALIAQGKFTHQTSDQFVKYADSLQEVTTVGNEVIIQGGALITSLSGLTGQGLERATKASLNLAAALNIDTNTAFNLVGKAATGYVSQLSRYGIVVKTTGDKTRDFNNALALIEKKFSGQAEAKIHTYSGALTQLNNTWGDFLKIIGNSIIKSPVLIELIGFVSKKIKEMGDVLAGITKDNGDFIGDMIKRFLDFSQVMNVVVGGSVEFIYNLFKALGTIIGGVAASIVQLASGEFSSAFETIKQVGDDATSDLFNFDTTVATAGFIAQLQTVAANATEPAKAVGNQIAAAIGSGFRDAGPIIVDSFTQVFSQASLTSDKFIEDIKGKLTGAFRSFRDGISGSFQVIGQALQKGQNAWEAFGKAILGMIGDLAIQLGQFYFLLGIANLFFNPAAAAAQIAAGIALQILGGFLKALSGGAGSSVASTSTGGGVAAQSPTGTENPATQQQEPAKPNTQVQVVVQGNILNNKESALYIADVLNESFRTDGTVVATA